MIVVYCQYVCLAMNVTDGGYSTVCMFSYERNWWGLFYKRQYVCLAMNVTDEGYSANVSIYV